MNIDSLIFPRFKRFKTMNLGLKRLLFILTFPICLGLWATGIFALFIDNGQEATKEGLGIIAIGIGGYLGFWIGIRIVFWIYDGFKGKENEMTV